MKSSQFDAVHKIACQLTLDSHCRVMTIHAGGNSCVYGIEDSHGKRYALKSYLYQDNDPRDRLSTEFYAFRFLAKNGVSCVPEAIHYDRQTHFALYDWINGKKVTKPTQDDMHHVITLIEQLFTISRLPDAEHLKPASAACFSVQDVVQIIDHRLQVLQMAAKHQISLQHYLVNDFIPTYQNVMTWALSIMKQYDWPVDQKLNQQYCLLSPSDFGFHNALRVGDKNMIFIDFEYFGWDDPVKMIADFLWHPAMHLDDSLKHYLIIEMCAMTKEAHFKQRLILLYPLFGLIWCLIMLNEFLSDGWQKRTHGGQLDQDQKDRILIAQLNKSKEFLFRIQNTYQQFPYGH